MVAVNESHPLGFDGATIRRTTPSYAAFRNFFRGTEMAALAACLSFPVPAHSWSFGPETPATIGTPAELSMTLYVEVIVNGLSTRRIAKVEVRNGSYFVSPSDLNGVSLPQGAAAKQWVDLSSLDEVRTRYDSAAQVLLVTVPTSWLPSQQIDTSTARERSMPEVSAGLLVNYDIYASAPSNGVGQMSVWTEQRLFDRWGTVANTGIYRTSFGTDLPGNSAQRSRYLRFDTSFTYTDPDTATTYIAGDLVTGALAWNSPIRLGGLSVSRDFTSRPDIVTYPLPQFSGQAAVPTAVDLLINGSKAATANVDPGPFVFNQSPFVNGAGEATVITTDALGRKVETSVPFYVANTLLRPGLWDYSLSAGAIRRGYGVRSFAYGNFAISGSVRYGATPYLTLEGHVEGKRDLQSGGLGVGIRIGLAGVIDGSLALSNAQSGTGRQYSVGYNYSSRRFSFSVRHIEATSGFRELASVEVASAAPSSFMRSSTQANLSVNLGRIGGTLGAAYFDVSTADGRDSHGANLSYTRPISNLGTLFASISRTFGNDGVSAQAQFIIPLGTRGSASAELARGGNGDWSARARYSRSVPTDTGLGWNLGYATSQNDGDVQGDLTWRNRFFQVQAGAYRSGEQGGITPWAEMQGSLVIMGGAILPANRINDAFALIDTQGIPHVPVRYENQPVGTTDGNGHLLVPWAPSYYPAKYEIDPLALGEDIQTSVIEQHVAVRAHAGARIVFPVKRIISATILLIDEAGKPIGVGAEAVHRESGKFSLVGWGGETYFDDLTLNNVIDVSLAGDGRCQVSFSLASVRSSRRVGPLTCRRNKESSK